MNKILTAIFSCLVLVALGVGAGYMVALKAGATAAAAPPDVAGPREFSEQGLKNLGVRVGKAELTSFVEHRLVHAVVRDAPLNERWVAAPLSGVVQHIDVRPGTFVAAGGGLVRIVRDALPRPKLELTADMFRPVSESLHSAFSSVRTATKQLEIAEKELRRVKDINQNSGDGAPLVARKTEIDLGYARERARQELENAQAELEHHGLTESEIVKVVSGHHPPRSRDLWRGVLIVHGLWTASVKSVFDALPPAVRELPWTIATLGELSASGLVDDSFVALVKSTPAVRDRFIDSAGLLLRGHTVARLRWLAAMGALESEFVLRAPPAGANGSGAPEDWDVAEIFVRPGQPVTAGEKIAVLHDPREMWLRLEPVGDEIKLVLGALRDGTVVNARPLLEGVGPELSGLRISRLETRRAATAGGDQSAEAAYVQCVNQRIGGDANRKIGAERSWMLRTGMRYVVRFPSRAHEDVFVFQKDAVAKEGPDRVIYVQNGKSFRPSPVHVLYEDDEKVVVAHDGGIFPGDDVVLSGGFVLGVAMQQSGGGGHGHTH